MHYRSMDGSGMFNWRFIFPFKFHKAEEKIVTFKRATLFAADLTEEKHKPLIYLQVSPVYGFPSYRGEGIRGIPLLGLFPGKSLRDIGNRALSPKEMRLRD